MSFTKEAKATSSFSKVAKTVSSFAKVAKLFPINNFVFNDGNNFVFNDGNNFIFEIVFTGNWSKLAKAT